ncbi:MAG: hypothetical protein ABT940_06730 [Alphaproteobacteria bacterium]
MDDANEKAKSDLDARSLHKKIDRLAESASHQERQHEAQREDHARQENGIIETVEILKKSRWYSWWQLVIGAVLSALLGLLFTWDNIKPLIGGFSAKLIVQFGPSADPGNSEPPITKSPPVPRPKPLEESVVKPSCWTSEDGSVESLYTITLSRGSIRVEADWTPEQYGKVGAKPMFEVLRNRDWTLTEFEARARPIYNLSVRNKCRYYVQLYRNIEATPEEQDVVEKFFYVKKLRD